MFGLCLVFGRPSFSGSGPFYPILLLSVSSGLCSSLIFHLFPTTEVPDSVGVRTNIREDFR